jgi:hypothetical protein
MTGNWLTGTAPVCRNNWERGGNMVRYFSSLPGFDSGEDFRLLRKAFELAMTETGSEARNDEVRKEENPS